MKQCHIFISGFVQNVGFRHFVRSKANEFGLNGYVQNLPDGRVEAIFQGPKSAIEEMIKQCRKGPFLSEVEEVNVKFEDSKEKYATFDIL